MAAGSSIGSATFSKSKLVPQKNRSSAQVEESQDEHDSPSTEASILATIPNSDSRTVLIEKLDCAMETDLWKHVESFLLRYTLDHLTENATDSEIRALVQLLSYPQRRSLELDWVNRFQKGRRRRIRLVLGLVLRAVSDTTLECDACSTDEDLSRYCSTLRGIQPGHIILKELVGGQCCHCVVRERECEKSLDTTEHSAQPTSSNAPETQDVSSELRQMARRMFAITFFQAAEDHKLSLPPSNGQYVEQCARNVERRVFESTISQKDYVIKKQAVLNNLNKLHGQAAAQWFPGTFHDRLPIQSLCATRVPNSPAREEPEAAFERLESGYSRDCRQDSSLYEQRRHPDASTEEQQSAQDPSEQRLSAVSSPVVPHLDSVRDTTTVNENSPQGHGDESYSSILKRSLTIGMKIQELDERDRTDMMQWFDFVSSTDDLDKMKKALELAVTIQNLPLELRREPRQACVGLLQALLPEEPQAKWMATMFNASQVFLKLQRDIVELKIASRGQRNHQ